MKTLCLALVLAAGLGNAAIAAARPFEKTVAPFDPSPNVLPVKFPKVWIKDVPEPNGRLSTGGAGGMSRQFYDWLYPWLLPWANTRKALDFESVTFQETINDMGVVLQKSIAAVPGDKLQKFNHDVGGQLKTELNAYRNLRGKEVIAGEAVKVAMTKTQAALKDVEQNEELVAAQADVDRKASLAADKAAIQKKIAESKQVQEIFTKAVGTTVDIMGIVADPIGSAPKAFGMVTGAIIGMCIDEHETELMVLDMRMEALDEAIAKHKHGAMEAALAKAKLQLKAASIEAVQRMLEEQQVIAQQSQAIDNLADLEKGARLKRSANSTDVFVDLRSVNQQFLLAATDLRRRLTRYQLVLDHGPGRRAKEWAPYLSKSIVDVSNYSNPDQQWLEVAKGSRDYMEKHAAWYPKEHDFVAAQRAALNRRVEVLPIDDAVQQLLAKFN